MRLSDQIRNGAIHTERQAKAAIQTLFTTVEHTPQMVAGRRELAAELRTIAGLVADPSVHLAQGVRALLQQGIAEAGDRFADKTRGERWQAKNGVVFDGTERRTNVGSSPTATRVQQLTPGLSPTTLKLAALVQAGLHLNGGSHVLLPGIGNLQETFGLDARGRLRAGRDASTLLQSIGFAVAPQNLPIAGEVVVPMMTPLSNQPQALKDAGRELAGYVPAPGLPDAGMSWLHGRTGVFLGADEGGEARIVMLKGGGQDHRSVRAQRVPDEVVTVEGKRKKPSKSFTPSAYATATNKELVPMLRHRSWSVTGGTNSENTSTEVENLTRLHGTFAAIMDGSFHGTPAQEQAAARLKTIAETWGIDARSVLPVPVAVVAMKAYPALDGGRLAFVDAAAMHEGAYKAEQFESLVVYAYEAPAASRLTMPRGQEHLRAAFEGKASAEELAFWNAELKHLGLHVTDRGTAWRTDQGTWVPVTKDNVEQAVASATKRAHARLELCYLLLVAAGDDQHAFPLRDIALSGAVFDFDFSRDTSLRDKAEHLVQDFLDGGWAAAGRQANWLAELRHAV